MEFDSMAALAASDHVVGLILECHDPRCGREAWRDFQDFPPDLTLRQLRRRARCDCCGSLGGRGVWVYLVHTGFSTGDPSPAMVERERHRSRKHREYLCRDPFGWRGVAGGGHRPDPALLDDAHRKLGLPMCWCGRPRIPTA